MEQGGRHLNRQAQAAGWVGEGGWCGRGEGGAELTTGTGAPKSEGGGREVEGERTTADHTVAAGYAELATLRQPTAAVVGLIGERRAGGRGLVRTEGQEQSSRAREHGNRLGFPRRAVQACLLAVLVLPVSL